jgi:hypothetical protein
MLVEEANKHKLQMEAVVYLQAPQTAITYYATLPNNLNHLSLAVLPVG